MPNWEAQGQNLVFHIVGKSTETSQTNDAGNDSILKMVAIMKLILC